jgi:GT2 family glycosyltransferase
MNVEIEISTIIVNWNSVQYLPACLQSLRIALAGHPSQVIVIDNASYDGSKNLVPRVLPEALFIQGTCNSGFASANNAAAKFALGRYLLFLNPDTVVEASAVSRLVQALEEDPGAAIAGPRVLNRDGTVQTSCVQSFHTIVNQLLDLELLRRLWPDASMWGAAVLREDDCEPAVVETVAGSCLLIRREAFQALGGFDTGYFMYGEDRDLCWRSRQHGWTCLHVPRARITHYGGGSSATAAGGFSVVESRRSTHRFLREHRGAGHAALYRLCLGAISVPRMAAAIVTLPFRGRRSFETMRKWTWIMRWSVGLTSRKRGE